MDTLQIQDVFEPYYAGRKSFFDHSEPAGNDPLTKHKDRQRRRDTDVVVERRDREDWITTRHAA